MKKIAFLCAAVAISAALVSAQGMGRRNNGGAPPDPQTMIQRRVDMLATVLNLTDAQKTQATTIFTNALTAGQNIRPNMQAAHQSLADAIKKNDTAAIDSLSATIGNLMGQTVGIESKADAAFYALLTQDQQAKYDAMPRGFGAGGGMRGPGGPGMMGPGMGQSRMPRSQSQQ
jgi:2C-methyl-D-erythritol 2,4-cyclodiphosphate synthase